MTRPQTKWTANKRLLPPEIDSAHLRRVLDSKPYGGQDGKRLNDLVDAVVVYTDGAYSSNTLAGGWAWVREDGVSDSGGTVGTTNQRMEMTAALKALEAHPGHLVIVSDSAYVVNCHRDGWYRKWLKHQWVNSENKPVKNRDLWEQIFALSLRDGRPRPGLTFLHVRGHRGHALNEMADQLAVKAKVRALEWASWD